MATETISGYLSNIGDTPAMLTVKSLVKSLSITALGIIILSNPVQAEMLEDDRKFTQIAQGDLTSSLLLEEYGTLEIGDNLLDNGRPFDLYRFEGKADQTVSITLKSTAFDTFLVLKDSEGNLLAENNDIEENLNSAVVMTLPTDGTYQVLVSSYKPDEQGTYDLQILSVGVQQNDPLLAQQNSGRQYGESLIFEGVEHLTRGDSLQSINSFELALTFFNENNDITGKHYALSFLSILHWLQGESEKAITLLEQALSITKRTNELHVTFY